MSYNVILTRSYPLDYNFGTDFLPPHLAEICLIQQKTENPLKANDFQGNRARRKKNNLKSPLGVGVES